MIKALFLSVCDAMDLMVALELARRRRCYNNLEGTEA